GSTEAIATARGSEVVERHAEAIGPQEPRERFPHARKIMMIAGREVGASESQHESRGVDGLLVPPGRPRRFPAAVPASVADEHEVSLVKADLLQELQCLASDAEAGPLARHRVRLEEREGDHRVVVRERRLEPPPTFGGLVLIALDELVA